MQTITVNQLINRGINGELCKIPYQRRFVWKEKNMVALLDSMYKKPHLGIGEVKATKLTGDIEDTGWEYVTVLDGMEQYPLKKKSPLYALVDFQQRATTLLMFSTNNKCVENIKYDTKKDVFVKNKSTEVRHFIPVYYFFQFKTSSARTNDDMLKKYGVSDDVIDRVVDIRSNFSNLTIPLYADDNMTLLDQCNWFNNLNGSGVKTTEFDTTSNTMFIKTGKDLNTFAREIQRIANKHCFTLYDSLPSNSKSKTLSALLLPIAKKGIMSRSVPYASEISNQMKSDEGIESLKNAYEPTLSLFDKVCDFSKSRFALVNQIQLTELYYVFATVENVDSFIKRIDNKTSIKLIQDILNEFNSDVHHGTGGTRKTKLNDYMLKIKEVGEKTEFEAA